jgi:hypothetical protein
MPEQSAAVLGPYSWNSMLPPGAEPPVKAAMSITVVPGGPPGLALVEIAGDAFAPPVPVRVRLAVAAGLLLVAVSVAL